MKYRTFVTAFCMSALLWSAAGRVPAEDWPGYRGPNGDGTVARLPEKFAKPKLVWQQETKGTCHAGMAVVGGILVTPDYDGENDYYRALDAKTGELKWERKFPNDNEMDWTAGPRANPLVHDGKVYVLGALGDLHCFDFKTGKTVWTKEFQKDFGARSVPQWGFCGSPIIADGKLIVHPKSLVALNPSTGELVWQGKAASTNYSTPLVGKFGGVMQVIDYESRALGGWDLKTGERLWKLPVMIGEHEYIVPSPVAVGDKVLVCHEDDDARLLAFADGGKVVEDPVGENERLRSGVPTPTLAGKLVIASGPGLLALSTKDIETVWKNAGERTLRGDIHVIVAKDRALCFNSNGYMLLMAIKDNELEVLGKQRLCQKTVMHPSLTGDLIYVRDETMLYCFDLRGE